VVKVVVVFSYDDDDDDYDDCAYCDGMMYNTHCRNHHHLLSSPFTPFSNRDPAHAKYKGFFHGVKTIIAEEKLGGIYRGLAPTIAKVATAQATRFGVFQVIGTQVKLDNPFKSAAAGAFAGGVSVVLFQVRRRRRK